MSKSQGRNRNRRRWLFEQQRGFCYLMVHQHCKDRGGAMVLKNRNSKGPFATVEHVIAKSRKVKGEPHYVLLACFDCNGKKSDADPTAQTLALAMRLHDEWITHAESKHLQATKPKHPRVGDLPKPMSR